MREHLTMSGFCSYALALDDITPRAVKGLAGKVVVTAHGLTHRLLLLALTVCAGGNTMGCKQCPAGERMNVTKGCSLP
jgi:hypothetical protein